jgi:hypothetical protein
MAAPSSPNTAAAPPIQVIVTLQGPPPPAATKPGFFSSLDGFFKSSLGVALLTLLSTGLIGGLITNYFADRQRQASEYSARIAESETSRRALIESFSKTYAARRTTLGLARSTIEAGGKGTERETRWKAYQEAYLAYNLNGFAFRAGLIDYLGYGTSLLFTPALEQLTSSFSRLDVCVTKAYRLDVAGKRSAAKAQLQHCRVEDPAALEWQATEEMKTLNSCLSTVEIELASSIYLENKFERLDEAERNVEVVRLVDSAPPSSAGAAAPLSGRLPVKTKAKVVEIKTTDLKASDWNGRKCATNVDWVCLRLLNRQTLKKKLGAPVCASLASKNYVATPPQVAAAGPVAAAGKSASR